MISILKIVIFDFRSGFKNAFLSPTYEKALLYYEQPLWGFVFFLHLKTDQSADIEKTWNGLMSEENHYALESAIEFPLKVPIK